MHWCYPVPEEQLECALQLADQWSGQHSDPNATCRQHRTLEDNSVNSVISLRAFDKSRLVKRFKPIGLDDGHATHVPEKQLECALQLADRWFGQHSDPNAIRHTEQCWITVRAMQWC